MRVMNILGAAAVACMLTGCVGIGKKASEPEVKLEMIGTDCVRAKAKIVIDGKMDEAWKDAPVVTHFRVPPKGAEPISKTEGRIMWDDEYLYVLLTAKDQDLMAYTDFRDGPTYKDDVLEFFFAPGPGKKTYEYINFEINAAGTVYDAYQPDRRKKIPDTVTKLWNCEGVKSAVVTNGTLNEPMDKDEGWCLELAVPFKSIPWMAGREAPEDGEEWSFHFARYDYSKYLPDGIEELSSTAPLPMVWFHAVDYFAPLTFKK